MGCFSCCLAWVGLIIVAAGIAVKLYVKLTTRRNGSYTTLVGKTVIVTGANTGIGYTTALDFAMRGARVILACRNKEKAEDAQWRIIKATGNENVVVKLIDLQSFDSVRQFAKDINETEKRVDILVNNAAVAFVGDEKTNDGLHVTMQANHFSPFLLTHLLIGKLRNSAPSRIVNVSSEAAKSLPNLDPDNLNKHPERSGNLAEAVMYANTKLCNILFTTELAKKLEGTGITVNCLHPGVIKTDLNRSLTGFFKVLLTLSARFLKTPEEGAQTTIYVALSKDIDDVSGELFQECHKIEMYKSAKNSALAQAVWKKSEEFVKLKNEEKL